MGDIVLFGLLVALCFANLMVMREVKRHQVDHQTFLDLQARVRNIEYQIACLCKLVDMAPYEKLMKDIS